MPDWPNKPVVIVADEGREFAISRTEPFAGYDLHAGMVESLDRLAVLMEKSGSGPDRLSSAR